MRRIWLAAIGAAPGAGDPVPAAFVVDARLKPGDGECDCEFKVGDDLKP